MIRFDRSAVPPFIVTCVTLLLSAVVFRVAIRSLNVFLQKQPVELRNSFANLPRKLGPWKKAGEDVKFDEAILGELGTDDYITRFYMHADDDERIIALHLAYYTGFIDAVPHVPDRCFEAGGLIKQSLPRNIPLDIDTSRWRTDSQHSESSDEPFPWVTYTHPMTGRPVTIYMPLGEFTLRVTRFQQGAASDRPIYAGYFFIANGRAAATPEAVKALAFDPSERYAYYAKVQFSLDATADYTEDDFVQDVQTIAEPLLPALMWCLPDWPEVESRIATETGASTP